MSTKRFRKWLKESSGSDLEAISIHKEMAQIPKPTGWAGPFDARFDDREGRFSKGDKIYWNRKSGQAGQNMPAYTDDDPHYAPRPTAGANTAQNVTRRARPTQARPQATLEAPEGMKAVPRPAGWKGPFAAKWDDKKGRWKEGDMIYWNGKKGFEAESIPAFVPEDMDVDFEGGNVASALSGKKPRPQQEEVRHAGLPREQFMNKYNLPIEQKFLQSDDDIMIDALAGSGKTTILKHLSSFIKPGEKWLYLVFNSKNAEEGNEEFPKEVDVMTTHVFLGNLLKGAPAELGGGTRLQNEDEFGKRITAVADKIIPKEWPETSIGLAANGKSPFWKNAKWKAIELAELAKAFALNPQDPEIEKNIYGLIEKYNKDMDCSLKYKPKLAKPTPEAIQMCQDLPEHITAEITKQIVAKSIEILNATLPGQSRFRDQDDTLWYAAMNADRINWQTQYTGVMMDEVQDFNVCQLIMTQKLKEAGHRIIAVGDPNQGMYSFRGSTAAAFDQMKSMVGGGQSMDLPINQRSGENIINFVNQNTHVNNLEAAERYKGQGEVWADMPGATHPGIGYQQFMGMIIEEAQGGNLQYSTCMIARNNAPLAVAAIEFLKAGVDFEIVGVDLSQQLVKQIYAVVNDYKDPETDKNPFLNWGSGSRPTVEMGNVSLTDFMNTIVPNFVQTKSKLWHGSARRRDDLKKLRGLSSILGYIWSHIQDGSASDPDAAALMEEGKHAGDLISYLKNKLSGKNPDKLEDMKKLSEKQQRSPNSFVTLTTAHRSKGLQWERVFIMQPGVFNPEGDKIRTEEDAQQERNALYVAFTRPEKVLIVSNDDEPKSGSSNDDDGGEMDNMVKMMMKM